MQQLIYTIHAVNQIMREHLVKSTGLTPSQILLLLALQENDGVSQTRLVKVSRIDRSTLADMVRRMLRSGHLSRKRTREDARAYAVRLTPLGEDTVLKYRKAERALAAALHQRVGGLNGLTIIETEQPAVTKGGRVRKPARASSDKRASA